MRTIFQNLSNSNFSIISKFQITPYGQCHCRFSKLRDKIFRRQINHCQFDGIRNFTSIDGLTQHNYQQSVVYIQNAKSNADIVDIEGEEKMILKSSIIADWNLIVETKYVNCIKPII
ncbi:unnamed protein product [Onchocerca flexuosa]|uniref:Uncharacterized protein n=1 Tax=Onchocerca flexuosa TaxID=387005 RepID=A0A3P8AYU8_9BILA|nr:unnamed protein product [Onchocerca flexuosa]